MDPDRQFLDLTPMPRRRAGGPTLADAGVVMLRLDEQVVEREVPLGHGHGSILVLGDGLRWQHDRWTRGKKRRGQDDASERSRGAGTHNGPEGSQGQPRAH